MPLLSALDWNSLIIFQEGYKWLSSQYAIFSTPSLLHPDLLPPTPLYFLSLRSECSPQRPVFFRMLDEIITGIAQSLSRRATGWAAGVWFPVGARYFIFSKAARPARGPIEPPIQWQPGVLFPVLKLSGREADLHEWSSYAPTPQYPYTSWF
jgi:hypothetical protein